MLQQTTVQTVAKRYGEFLRRFPDVRTLARAREDSVLAAWSGLGYYNRARNLHRAAKEIVSRHGGRFPRDPEALRRLPGFGPYIAAAVAALAFDAPTQPVEANIRRVVSRLFATNDPASKLAGLIGRRPADSIAALFDLGQLVCRPRNPACDACPLASACRARRIGRVGSFPRKRILKPYRPVFLCAAAVARSGRYWLRRRRSTWLSGMWEFPSVEGASAREARARFRRVFGIAPLVGAVEHTVVRRRIRVEVYRAGSRPPEPGGRWMTIREVRERASPTLTKKIAGLLSPAPSGA